jgi:apolipoprotein D and lipocalin family protein
MRTLEPADHLPAREREGLRARDLVLPGLLVLGAGALVAGFTATRPVGNPRVPEPAKPVDLNRYLGRWFEFARYDSGFEQGCEAATAEYALRTDGLIRVLNICHQGSIDGPTQFAEGKARVVDGSGGTKLKVSFFGPFYFGNYWVLDHADDYSWSIVGEPTGKYLWILSRDPTPSEVDREMLIERAQALGYDTGMLRMTKQKAA